MSKLKVLVLIGVGGLWACTGMMYIFINKTSKYIINSSLGEEALTLLKQNEGAVYYLGQPIETNLASFNKHDPANNDIDIKINVKGSKSKGVLFLTGESDEDNKTRLKTVQLQLGKDKGRRIVIKE